MSEVLGRNLTIYVGDGMKTIGCEDSCTFTLENELINVTTKGSGKGTNREYGGYDWNIQASGVVFLNASWNGSATNLDPFEFLAYSLEGKKVAVTFEHTDGSTTRFFSGIGLIGTCSYTGQAEGHAMYNVTILADGLLYPSQTSISSSNYDGPRVYIYESTGTVDGFAHSSLVDSSYVYFVHRSGNGNNILWKNSQIETLALPGDLPAALPGCGFNAANGTFNFNTDLLNNDIVFVCFDNVD